MTEDRYFNLGWFGNHPKVYDLANLIIAPIRSKGASMIKGKNLKILDVAAGTGAQTIPLAKAGHSVIGIDLDPQMIAKAKEKLKPDLDLNFKVGDGTNLEFENESFDRAVISFAIHDVPFDIGVKLLKEAKRVIKSNGQILVIDYMEPNKSIPAKILKKIASIYESPNYHIFIENGLEKYIKEAKLKVEKKDNYLGLVQYVSIQK